MRCLSGMHCLFKWLQERAAPRAWISLVIQKKKKALQKYLLCKLFILMPRVKTISIKWTNPATSFLGVKVSWERVLNSYLHFTQSFKSSSWTMFCHHILWLSIGQFLITLSYALTGTMLLGKLSVGPFIRY